MKKFCFCILSLLGGLNIYAQQYDAYRLQIDSLITAHPLMKHASLGALIYDVQEDSVVYSLDASKLHRPASTVKTFTCATALKNLGTDYCIRTSMYTTGEFKNMKVLENSHRILDGDLFIKGNFDPAFSAADLDTLLLTLKSEEIDSITGSIYADVSMKNRTLKGYGWCWDDTGDDSPLLSPLVVDKDTCFMTRLSLRLDSLGIKIGGEVSDSIVPEGARLLAEKSRMLQEILPHCLKTSDNRYAESILYQLGNLNDIAYDPTSASLEFVNQYIEELGFTKNEYHFVDGSGLSFYNMVTPEVEVALLKDIYLHQDFYDVFRAALPVSGVDGTLKNRMKGTPAEGHVFAKTGSLTGTYALAGYLIKDDNKMYIFSLMNDGVPIGEGNRIRQLQDDILNIIAK